LKSVATYPIASIGFWKCYGVHMRPYLLFVSGITGLMGTTLAHGSMNYFLFSISIIPFFFGYGFGQALTDAFQTDTDKISSPYRPLSKGYISPGQVLKVSISGLIFIASILIYLSWYNIILCTLSIIGLATYSYVKHFWPFGPFHNSWIVMLLPIMGFLAMGGRLNLHSILTREWIPYLITFTSYYNFVLIDYLKDIDADRQTGYHTFPVVFGWMPTLWLGNLNIVIYLVLGYLWLDSLYSLGGFILILTAIVAFSGQIKGHFAKDHSPISATLPIENTVRALVLIHIMIMIKNRPELLWFCLIFYLLFEITLWRRPEKTQI